MGTNHDMLKTDFIISIPMFIYVAGHNFLSTFMQRLSNVLVSE